MYVCMYMQQYFNITLLKTGVLGIFVQYYPVRYICNTIHTVLVPSIKIRKICIDFGNLTFLDMA